MTIRSIRMFHCWFGCVVRHYLQNDAIQVQEVHSRKTNMVIKHLVVGHRVRRVSCPAMFIVF